MRKPGRRKRKARAMQRWESKRGRAKWAWLARHHDIWTTRTAIRIKSPLRRFGCVLAHCMFITKSGA